MGRSLGNTMVNLGMEGECDEAVYQVTKLLTMVNCCMGSNSHREGIIIIKKIIINT